MDSIQALTEAGVLDSEFLEVAGLPHPLLSMAWLPDDVRAAWSGGNAAPLLSFLSSAKARQRALGPLFDARKVALDPVEHPGGVLGQFLQRARPTDQLPVPDVHPGQAPTLGLARSELLRLANAIRSATGPITWPHVPGSRPRVKGRVSVVVHADGASRRTIRTVASTIREGGVEDVEAIVVDSSADVGFALDVGAAFLGITPFLLELAPGGTPEADCLNRGAALATGELVVFLSDTRTVGHGWLAPLVRSLGNGGTLGAQPLVLDNDSCIHAAGIAFTGPERRPSRVMAGHPADDGTLARGRPQAALVRHGLALRTADFDLVGGFDAATEEHWDIDLCLRLASRRPGAFQVEPDSAISVDHEQDRARSRPSTPSPQAWGELLVATPPALLDPLPDVRSAARTGPCDPSGTRLRWGLRIASTPGPVGDAWGDTHLAASLAEALRERGQHVVVHRRGLHGTSAARLDDVVLGIRGLVPVLPEPGKLNILWIISHPEEVTPEELSGFDLIYAASPTWSAEMAVRADREVRTLLQATDLGKAPDLATPRGDGSRPLFVGTGKGRRRPIVEDSLAAGLDVAVYGPGWRRRLPERAWLGPYLSNADLLAGYRRHGLVLADHWPDMADRGFIANRIFDAVAAGAWVVSDRVAGMDDLFRGAVQCYSSLDDLRDLARGADSGRFPPAEEMDDIAASVRREHSFQARASRLLGDVTAQVR